MGGLLLLAAASLWASGSVSVYLDFAGTPSLVSMDAMKTEAANLMEPAGFRLAWRQLNTNHGTEGSERVVVVHLKGTCATGAAVETPRDEDPEIILGSTAVASGQVLPYSEIACDAVRRFLPETELPGSRADKDSAFGRALGRVLAHELYHALLRTTHHGRVGFAKAVQTPRELLSRAPIRPSDFTAQ